MSKISAEQALENRIASKDTREVVRTLESIGGADQIRQVVREQANGYGKLKRRVETWQNLAPQWQMNEALRNGTAIDRFISPTPGHKQEMFLDAVVPYVVYKHWRDVEGFDLLRADLNDPQQRQVYERLISAPELKGIMGEAIDPRNCRVYRPSGTSVLIDKRMTSHDQRPSEGAAGGKTAGHQREDHRSPASGGEGAAGGKTAGQHRG